MLLEIWAQNPGNAISEDPKLKNFAAEHAPGPPSKKAPPALDCQSGKQ